MQLNPINTAITAAAGTTLSAAALLGLYITRTGPAGAFTDTLDTAANITRALKDMPGASFVLNYINNTGSVATIAAGDANTILSGASPAIPANSQAQLLITRGNVGQTRVTVVVLARNSVT